MVQTMDNPGLLNQRPVLYFEEQHGNLCGMHALNSLLQSPVFTHDVLVSYALELDAKENQLSGQSGGAAIARRSEPQNMDATGGMFSLQVLTTALSRYGLKLIRLHIIDAHWSPEHEVGFICNLREHWFTIRKVGEEWYDFNSLKSAPERISNFRLAAFMSGLLGDGYDIFVVAGNYPVFPVPSRLGRCGKFGVYLSADAAAALVAGSKAPSSTTWNSNREDEEIAKAIEASLSASGSSSDIIATERSHPPEQSDEQNAIEESRRMYELQQLRHNAELEYALQTSMFEK